MSTVLLIAAFAGGLFTAWAIGANSASPSFGPVTSAGAVNILRSSFIVGIAAFLGAFLQGGAVTDTVGNQLILGETFGVLHAAIILVTASTLILGGIIFKYPLPMAFTLVGTAIGTGIAIGGTPNIPKLQFIGSVWLVIPFIAIAISYTSSKLMRRYLEKTERNKKYIRYVLFFLGAYTAFTAGANQSGLVIGPLINSVSVDVTYLLMFAGGGMVIGAWTGSPRIIESVSQEYSQLGPRRAISALLAASMVAQGATLVGVPVSFNEAVIAAVIGSGLATGKGGVSTSKILNTVIVWTVTLIAATGIGYLITTLTMSL
jgi:PiT family inorganic phosphate transporter